MKKGRLGMGLSNLTLKPYIKQLFISIFKKFIVSLVSKNSSDRELLVIVHQQKLNNFLNFISRGFGFKILSDICAVDRFNLTKRFEIIYNVLSIKNKFRLFIKISTDDCTLRSINNIFSCSN